MSAEKEAQAWDVRAHIRHPDARLRERGESSRVELSVNRGLRGGRLDFIALSTTDAFRLAEELLHFANIAAASVPSDQKGAGLQS